MSAKGQKRTYGVQQRGSLFDHLIGAAEQLRTYGEAERLRCPHVQYEFELCRLLDRDAVRVDALQNLCT